jgi:starch phosphorylase
MSKKQKGAPAISTQPPAQNPPERVPQGISPASGPVVVEDDRTGMDDATFHRALMDNLFYILGVDYKFATPWNIYQALSYTVRDRLIARWIRSRQETREQRVKVVYYLSAEFLMGRQLANNLLNINCFRQTHRALTAMGRSIHDILEQEPEPALGNGGLGRLAACYLDSLATLEIPAIGYGIRYEYGIFKQTITNGWQIEHPDKWLRWGNPWEIARPQHTMEVGFEGRTEWFEDEAGRRRIRWVPGRKVLGTPHDVMIPGFHTNMVNTLRLWSAGTNDEFDFGIFNAGDYSRAVAEKTTSENISKVLYPNDNTPEGRALRLRQQYFFVCCALQDILRLHLLKNPTPENLPDLAAIQLNDTHPSIAVAELMRILVDVHCLSWEKAWEATVGALGYTNHTLMSEALERWPVDLFGWLLPRHLEIIYEINARFLKEVERRFPNDLARQNRLSIIEEGEPKKVRMGHLATVGSHSVNGVAKLHSELVKKELFADFHDLWPEKFSNVTNGVTPRRWVMLANPKLAFLIADWIGKEWIRDLRELKRLEPFADDAGFKETWRIFKWQNKEELSNLIAKRNGILVDPEALFDVQVKRMHEYKRQLLNVLHIITLYDRLRADPNRDIAPRVFILGGKAAPGYFMAKLVIKLIHAVADIVNHDPAVKDRMKVAFLADFSVSLGERVYPAADLSEQISTAGKEASGTGNMKFSLNGALTIGTLDGANIEIREAVGAENFFLFGHTVEEIASIRAKGYDPHARYVSNPDLREAIDGIASNRFSPSEPGVFQPIVDSLLGRDEYFLLADYPSYIEAQDRVAETFRDRERWTRMSILNVARMGFFSSDRAILEYARAIWGVKPIVLPNGADGRPPGEVNIRSQGDPVVRALAGVPPESTAKS